MRPEPPEHRGPGRPAWRARSAWPVPRSSWVALAHRPPATKDLQHYPRVAETGADSAQSSGVRSRTWWTLPRVRLRRGRYRAAERSIHSAEMLSRRQLLVETSHVIRRWLSVRLGQIGAAQPTRVDCRSKVITGQPN